MAGKERSQSHCSSGGNFCWRRWLLLLSLCHSTSLARPPSITLLTPPSFHSLSCCFVCVFEHLFSLQSRSPGGLDAAVHWLCWFAGRTGMMEVVKKKKYWADIYGVLAFRAACVTLKSLPWKRNSWWMKMDGGGGWTWIFQHRPPPPPLSCCLTHTHIHTECLSPWRLVVPHERMIACERCGCAVRLLVESTDRHVQNKIAPLWLFLMMSRNMKQGS